MRAIERTVLFSFLLLFLNVQTVAQYLNNSNVEYLVQSGIWSLLVNNRAEAERYSAILQKHFPRYPLSFILPVLNEMAVSEDCGRELNDVAIQRNLTKAALLSDSLLAKEKTAENYFFSALAEGVLAYYEMEKNNLLSAFFNGLSALEKFNNCLEKSPRFAAAQVAIGSYKYWVSEKVKAISWLPLIPDEREEGIRMLQLGLRENSVLYHFGLESLIWIYIHQKEFEKAERIALQAVKTYPKSRYFIYALAHAFNSTDKSKANELFQSLIESRKRDGCLSNYWKVILLHKIAMNDEALGKFREAKMLCDEILKLELNSFEKRKLKGRLTRVEQLKESMVKKIKN